MLVKQLPTVVLASYLSFFPFIYSRISTVLRIFFKGRREEFNNKALGKTKQNKMKIKTEKPNALEQKSIHEAVKIPLRYPKTLVYVTPKSPELQGT